MNIKEQEAIKKLIQETVCASIQNYLSCTTKKTYDKRLRNTRLLLDNYTKFVDHCENAVYTDDQEEDIFKDDEIVIHSILKSKKRTQAMIKHIESCMEAYITSAYKSNEEEFKRRAEAVKMIYVEKKKHNDVAEFLHVHPVTLAKDRKKIAEELSVYFFGIDGLKFE